MVSLTLCCCCFDWLIAHLGGRHGLLIFLQPKCTHDLPARISSSITKQHVERAPITHYHYYYYYYMHHAFIVAIASDNPNHGGPCPRQAARHHRRARRLLFVLAGLMLFASLVGLTSAAALLALGGLNILYGVWCGASTRGSDVSGSWWRWPAIGRRRRRWPL